MPVLRHLTVDDYDAIVQLWQLCGLRSIRLQGRDSRDAFAAQLGAGQRLIGLEEGGRLIGAVVITHDSRKGWINRLVVHPDYRRKGYARQLSAGAEKQLSRMGLPIFAALIDADNTKSRKFFAREGYKTHDVVYVTKRDSQDA